MVKENCLNHKKNLFKIFLIIVIIMLIGIFKWYLFVEEIPGEIANNFSNLMRNHDIEGLDTFFNENTSFQYKDIVDNKTYETKYVNARKNIIMSFSDNCINYTKNHSHGSTYEDLFFHPDEEISVTVYIPNKYHYSEIGFDMQVELKGFNKYSIKKVSGTDPLFGYICLGIEPDPEKIRKLEEISAPPNETEKGS